MPLRAVLLDMGGVLLEFGNAEGLPMGRHDFRGREALVALLRDRDASRAGSRPRVAAPSRPETRIGQEELEELLFTPWKRDHARRYELGREADWHPHLARLRRRSRRRFSDRRLLATWFAPFAETVAPLPGAVEAVRALRVIGVPLALVSNIPLPRAHYEPLLDRYGMLAPFAVRQFSYEAGSRKPSPAMLLAALSALGVSPAEAIMVGDRRSADIAAGRSAGVRTVWLKSPDAVGPVPDHTIESMAELPALVRALAASLHPGGSRA